MGMKIFAPASLTNLSIGQDILALALDQIGDDIIIRESDTPGLKIVSVKRNKSISLDLSENVAGYTAALVLKHLGKSDLPLEIELYKKTPIGLGLGSCAASAVAGVMAVNEILGLPMEKRELLPFAIEGFHKICGKRRIHGLVASLMGGLQLTRDEDSLDYKRIFTPKGLVFLIIKPRLRDYKKVSNNNIFTNISHRDMVTQSANLAAFIAACYTSDFELIAHSFEDAIIEKYTNTVIPYYQEVKSIAMNHSALGFSSSGDGYSMFAICKNTRDIENIKESVQELYDHHKSSVKFYTARINQEGAYRY